MTSENMDIGPTSKSSIYLQENQNLIGFSLPVEIGPHDFGKWPINRLIGQVTAGNSLVTDPPRVTNRQCTHRGWDYYPKVGIAEVIPGPTPNYVVGPG
jgi:hypothetical protein